MIGKAILMQMHLKALLLILITTDELDLLMLQVIDETLRLGGIAIWLMREAKVDVTYEGISTVPD